MLSKEEVRYIASLSRIDLKDQEIEVFQKTLTAILDYIEKLKKLDVSGIAPTIHVLPLQDVFREDRTRPSLTKVEALRIAPAQAKGSFKVPQVIE